MTADSPADARAEVLEAAARLVEAFGRNDTEAYFDSFAEDATFVFHNHAVPLRSRQEYRDLWDGWQREGFAVRSCTSSDQHVQALGDDVAVFTHSVHTVSLVDGVEEASDERETIVFRREGGTWSAVHEHLSPHAR